MCEIYRTNVVIHEYDVAHIVDRYQIQRLQMTDVPRHYASIGNHQKNVNEFYLDQICSKQKCSPHS